MSTAFDVFARLLRALSGLELTSDRRDLVASRLMPLARRRSLASLDALARVLDEEGEPLALEIAEAMASSDTAFFRDRATFAMIRDLILPRLVALKAGSRRLRLWSAGCSTGQEAYSLAMILAGLGPRIAGWDVELIATDFSERFLEKARSGLFSQFEVQCGLPVRLLLEHFAREGDGWRIAPALRERVAFRRANLLDECPRFGTFDLILCRNVLWRFCAEERAETMDRLIARLAPGGTLVLGAEEGCLGADERLVVQPGAQAVFSRSTPGLQLAVG
jgi:chemotaxis protein methyltransferase CheR